MKLLDQVRQAARLKHFSSRTEGCCARWVEQFIRSHRAPEGWRRPKGLGAAEVEAFLTHLAVNRRASASTRNQALAALLFLSRDVLRVDSGALDATRATRTRRLPVVLSRGEVSGVLAAIDAIDAREPDGLMARLMCGAGLRLMECCRLRIKDIDLARAEITIRDGKGAKDRITLLPASLREAVAAHLDSVYRLHQ
ncbi:MAG TPA: phage integrase N-terminal SAM-like domain-containing protein, partial [Gemmataceae bacterium]|nr:phage integrase N-terminal SAM-like domain-containing protein [Gemmataceae bacterium]